MATKLQMAAAWMVEAEPGETYVYHIGWSLADERRRDKELDRVAKALALAAGCDPPEDEDSRSHFKLPVADAKKPHPKIDLFHRRVGRQTFYYARRLNDPPKDAFVQTADPRVSAYGWRNRIREDLA